MIQIYGPFRSSVVTLAMLLLSLSVMPSQALAQTWREIPDKRTKTSKTYQDVSNDHKFFWVGTMVPLHYSSELDSASFDSPIDMTPQRVSNDQFDGWRISQSSWHFALGKDLANHGDQDGWVGYGGRQGSHWLKFRLFRVGYLHWPTRSWQDIGGNPDYNRANLTNELHSLSLLADGSTQPVENFARWSNVWTTPESGSLAVSWRVNSDELKEEVIINQAGREWIQANRPPATPLQETYFGFVFQLDVSDIPIVYRAGLQQSIDSDYSDDGEPIQLKDAADHLLAFMPLDDLIINDSAGEEIARTPLRKRFYKDGSNYYLVIGVRTDVLNNMPDGNLVFDPTLTTQPDGASGIDVTLRGSLPDTNYGTYTILGVNLTYTRSLIKFDLSAIPNGSTIDAANFYSYHSGSGGHVFSSHNMYSILPANIGWTEMGATWNKRDGTNNWAGSLGCSTIGTDYSNTVLGVLSGYTDDPTGTEYNVALNTSEVTGWLTNNAGFIIIYTPGNSLPSVFSSDYSTASQRPKLVIQYTEANASPTNDSLTFTNPDGGSGNDAVADDTTEWNFRAVISDTDGYTDLDQVVLRLANSTDSTTPFDSLKFTWTEATDTFSEATDTQNAATITSSGADSSCSVNTCTLDFKIKFNSNLTSQSTNYNAELYTTDEQAAAATGNYADFYQVSSFETTISISSPNNISLGMIAGTGDTVTGQAMWTVTTNDQNGYKLEWQASSATMANVNQDTVAAFTPEIADIPEPWSVAASASEWGARLKSASTDTAAEWGTDSVSENWLNVATNTRQIVSRSSSTAGSDEIVAFKAEVGAQAILSTGDYTVNITVTATTL